MENIQGKVVIVTGASSGIGESTAKLLSKKGAKVVLAARRESKLQLIHEEINKNGGVSVYKVTDVTSKSDMDQLAQFVLTKFGTIDVIVNNAGVMLLSPLNNQNTKEWDTMIDINIKGVLYGISSVLPEMRSKKKGHIINIASVAGHVVIDAGAVYCATKFAVRAITEGLRKEEYQNNIRTTIISPGNIQTELPTHITHKQTKMDIQESINQYGISAESIARVIAHAINEPDEVTTNEMIIRPTKQKV